MHLLKLISITIFVMLSLEACRATGSQQLQLSDASECDFLAKKPQPEWITGNSQIPGFYTGVGEGNAFYGSDQALQQSRQNAIASLSSSIQTSISQKIFQTISDSSSNSIFNQQVASFTQSITRNSLHNIKRDGLWLDHNNCRLWTRVKVSVAEVNRIRQKELNQAKLIQANTLYQKAKDQLMLPVNRIENIEDAIRKILSIDFKTLPLENQTSYLEKYRALQLSILSLTGQQEVLIITLSEQTLPKSVQKEIAFRISKGMKNSWHVDPAPCMDQQSCLHYAHNMKAKTLLLVNIQSNIKAGDMGSHLGELKLDSTLIDIVTNRQLSFIQHQTGQTLSFDKKNMHWEQAIKRLFDDNLILTQHIQTIQRCTTETC